MNDILRPFRRSAFHEHLVNFPSIIAGASPQSSIYGRSPFQRVCIFNLHWQLAHFKRCLKTSRNPSFQWNKPIGAIIYDWDNLNLGGSSNTSNHDYIRLPGGLLSSPCLYKSLKFSRMGLSTLPVCREIAFILTCSKRIQFQSNKDLWALIFWWFSHRGIVDSFKLTWNGDLVGFSYMDNWFHSRSSWYWVTPGRLCLILGINTG